MTSLYLISPPSFSLSTFAQQLEEAFAGGRIDVFQLRMKDASEEEIITACKKLIPICHSHGTQFILNDRPDLVHNVGADGAHIGIEDGAVAAARKILGKGKVLGVSCYGDGDRAIDAAEAGADYVAFGAFYPTQTKTPRAFPKPDLIKWWVTNSVIPCVAIGGIKHHNSKPLVEAGADFIAVVTAVWDDAEGPRKGVEKMLMGLSPNNG